jgi:NADPH:quinone reductase-like Zn-dependent oxidoreductase
MQAINYTKYGPLNVLKLEEVRKPVPGNEEVLVRILASSVNFGNVALVKGEPFVSRFWSGLIKPKYTNPGSDISGVVEEVGKEVTRFKPGDEVIGDLVGCGLGAYAQYVACPESVLAMKPANISHEQAASVPQSALVALQGLRNKGNIQPGQKVLIYGASGGNGTFAVQVAKAFGAEVTGVCSTKNMELVRSIGADHVIDYTREDLFSQGGGYDLILSTAGYQSIYDYKRALGPRGTYVSAGGAMKQVNQGMLLGPLLSIKGGKKLTFLYQRTSQEDLFTMKELIEAGKVMPVIDRIYPLEDTIYAMEYYSKGRSRGKVIITMQDGMAE